MRLRTWAVGITIGLAALLLSDPVVAQTPNETVSITSAAPTAPVIEGASVEIVVTLSNTVAPEVTVPWVITGVDASDINGSLTGSFDFPAGASGANLMQTVTITIANDTVQENRESFVFTLQTPTTTDTTMVALDSNTANHSRTVNIEFSDYVLSTSSVAPTGHVNEGTNVDFDITLSGTLAPQVTVPWMITGVDAGDVAGSLTGSIVFPPNASGAALTQRVTVAIANDTVQEGQESLTLTLQSPQDAGAAAGLDIANLSWTVNIEFSDYLLTTHAAPLRVTEGMTGTFRVFGGRPFDTNVYVEETANITTESSDLNAHASRTSGRLLIPLLSTATVFEIADAVNPADDAIVEGDEVYELRIVEAFRRGADGADEGSNLIGSVFRLGTPHTRTYTIADNDVGALSFSNVSSTTVSEGQAVDLTVQLSHAAAFDVNVYVAPTTNTTTEDDDLGPSARRTDGILLFPLENSATEFEVTDAVNPINDAVVEGNEIHELQIVEVYRRGANDENEGSNLIGSLFQLGTPHTRTYTIVDTDTGTVRISDISPPTVSEGQQVDVTVQISHAIDKAVVVPITIGGSIDLNDLVDTEHDQPLNSLAGRVVFAAGSPANHEATFSFKLSEDGIAEPAETVTVTLSDPIGETTGGITASLTPGASTGTVTVNASVAVLNVMVNFEGQKYRQIREGQENMLRLRFDRPTQKEFDFHLHVSVAGESFSNEVGGGNVVPAEVRGDLMGGQLAGDISIVSPYGELEFVELTPADPNRRRVNFTVPEGVEAYDLRVMADADYIWEIGRDERFVIEFDPAHASASGSGDRIRYNDADGDSVGYTAIEYTVTDATRAPELSVDLGGETTVAESATASDRTVDVAVVVGSGPRIEGALTFEIDVAHGRGVEPTDYSVPSPNTVQLAAGSRRTDALTLTVENDAVDEVDEELIIGAWVQGQRASARDVDNAMLTISDDDREAVPVVSLTVATVPTVVTEGNTAAGTVTVTVTGNLQPMGTTAPAGLTIDLVGSIREGGTVVPRARLSVGGTPLTPSDALPLMIAAGQSSGRTTFALDLAGDTNAEPDSIITVGSGIATPAIVRSTSFTIRDDDDVRVVLEPVPSVQTGIGPVTYTLTVEPSHVTRSSSIVVPFEYTGNAVFVSDTDVDGVDADFSFGTAEHGDRNPTVTIAPSANAGTIVFNLIEQVVPHGASRHVGIRFRAPAGGGGRVTLHRRGDIQPADELDASTVLNPIRRPRISDLSIEAVVTVNFEGQKYRQIRESQENVLRLRFDPPTQKEFDFHLHVSVAEESFSNEVGGGNVVPAEASGDLTGAQLAGDISIVSPDGELALVELTPADPNRRRVNFTVPEGVDAYDLRVVADSDQLWEIGRDERFVIEFDPAHAAAGGPGDLIRYNDADGNSAGYTAIEYTITDATRVPDLSVDLGGETTVAESAPDRTVAVVVGDGPRIEGALTFEIAVAHGPGVEPTDYSVPSPSTVQLAAGATRTSELTLTVIDDDVVEVDEELTIGAWVQDQQGSARDVANAILTISDDDREAVPVVSLTVATGPAVVTEGNTATGTVAVTVTGSLPMGTTAPSGGLEIELAGSVREGDVDVPDTRLSVGGTPLPPTGGTLPLTIAAGERSGSAMFALALVGDTNAEPDTVVTVGSGITTPAIVRATSFTIRDDDDVRVVLQPVPSVQTEIGPVTYRLTVEPSTVTRSSNIEVPFEYTGNAVYVSDSDVDGVDADFSFGAAEHGDRNPTVTIAPGATAGTIVFNLIEQVVPHGTNRHLGIRFRSPMGGGGRVTLHRRGDTQPADELDASTVLNLPVYAADGTRPFRNLTVQFDQPIRISRWDGAEITEVTPANEVGGAVPAATQITATMQEWLPKLRIDLDSGTEFVQAPTEVAWLSDDFTTLIFRWQAQAGSSHAFDGVAFPQNALVVPGGTIIHIRNVPAHVAEPADVSHPMEPPATTQKVLGGRISWGDRTAIVTEGGSTDTLTLNISPHAVVAGATIAATLSGDIRDITSSDAGVTFGQEIVADDGSVTRRVTLTIPDTGPATYTFAAVDDDIWEQHTLIIPTAEDLEAESMGRIGPANTDTVRLTLDPESFPRGYRVTSGAEVATITVNDDDVPTPRVPWVIGWTSRSVISEAGGADYLNEGIAVSSLLIDEKVPFRLMVSGANPVIPYDLPFRVRVRVTQVLGFTESQLARIDRTGMDGDFEVRDANGNLLPLTFTSSQTTETSADWNFAMTLPALARQSETVEIIPLHNSSTWGGRTERQIRLEIDAQVNSFVGIPPQHTISLRAAATTANLTTQKIEIVSTPADPTGYRAGEPIRLEMVLDHLVQVNVPTQTDTPTLTLGGFAGTTTTKTATYSGGLGAQYTARIPFTYEVQLDDIAFNGFSVAIDALALPGAVAIQPVDGELNLLSGGTVWSNSNKPNVPVVAASADHRVLGVAPPPPVTVVAVQPVSTPADSSRDGYFKHETIAVAVQFSEPVQVHPGRTPPTLNLEFSDRVAGTDTTEVATYSRGSGTNSLVFSYTVEVGDSDLDGIEVPGNGLLDPANTIETMNGGELDTDFTGLAAQAGHAVYGKTISFAVGAISIAEPQPMIVIDPADPMRVMASNRGGTDAAIDDGSPALNEMTASRLFLLVEPKLSDILACETTDPTVNVTWENATGVSTGDYAPVRRSTSVPTDPVSYATQSGAGDWTVCLSVPDSANPDVNRSAIGIAIRADAEWEYGVDETVTVGIDRNGLPDGYVLGAHENVVVTIVDSTPSPRPVVQLSRTTVSEEASTLATRQFTAKLLIRLPGAPTSVFPSTSGREVTFALAPGGDVTPGTDITPPTTPTATLTSASGGQESTEVTFTVNDDHIVEGNEEVYVAAVIDGIPGNTLPSGAKHLSGPLHIEKGRLTVTETDQLRVTVTASENHAVVSEGSSATFNVSTNAAIENFTLKFPILLDDPIGSRNDAITVDDFVAPPRFFDLTTGATSPHSVTIPTRDDGVAEGAETFAFRLGRPIAVPREVHIVVGPAAESVIHEGEPPAGVTLTVFPTTVKEGGGTAAFFVTARTEDPVEGSDLVLNLAPVINGRGMNINIADANDYAVVGAWPTITIPVGERESTISHGASVGNGYQSAHALRLHIPTGQNQEPEETIVLTATTPNTGYAVRQTASITILTEQYADGDHRVGQIALQHAQPAIVYHSASGLTPNEESHSFKFDLAYQALAPFPRSQTTAQLTISDPPLANVGNIRLEFPGSAQPTLHIDETSSYLDGARDTFAWDEDRFKLPRESRFVVELICRGAGFATLDFDQNGDLTAEDAYILVLLFAPPSRLNLRQQLNLYRNQQRPNTPLSDAEYADLRNVPDQLQDCAVGSLFDLNESGEVDEIDGLILYWALGFPEVVGLGANVEPHGYRSFRRQLLQDLHPQLNRATDSELQRLVRRANDLREAVRKAVR